MPLINYWECSILVLSSTEKSLHPQLEECCNNIFILVEGFVIWSHLQHLCLLKSCLFTLTIQLVKLDTKMSVKATGLSMPKFN